MGSLHHIIKTLKLEVTLTKIKAHSGNTFNDIADALAKSGRFELSATSIAHNHIPTQTATLLWDDKIPLDKDVRKCVDKIINYKRIDNHLNHQELSSNQT